MAKQTGLFKFTGKLDNVIGYRRNGVHFVRSMPDSVRQTSATRQAARRFGIASRKGKLIRRALLPYLDLRQDGSLVNRLNKALIQAGSTNLRILEGFRFNHQAGTDAAFAQTPVFTTDGTLKIPAQKLSGPRQATHLEVRVIATRINFAEHRIENVDETTTLIDLRRNFMGAELNVDAAGSGTLLITLQVRPCVEENGTVYATSDRRYMAADIICIAAPAKRKHHHKTSRKKIAKQYPVYWQVIERRAPPMRGAKTKPPLLE